MPLVLADRVKETTTSVGTGTITLAGASTGFQSFAVIGNGNTTYYTIAGQGTSEWEVGIGTYTASGTTLSRDTVLASSAGAPNKTSFSSGVKDVFVTYTAARSVNVDGTSIDTFGLGAVQGDLFYASAADNFVLLNKNTTATRYLANTGANNNPAWAQVDLSNGVTGDLPFSNLTQGSALSVLGVTGNATADVASIAAGTDNQVLRRSGTALAFGAVNLASTDAVTGTLPVGNGGTGAATLTTNNVLLGNGTSAVQFVAPGANGNVLTSNGTTWTSAASAGFPAGTAMMFVQTAAPTGWTKSTTHDNKALRVVSGTASSGGSVAFTTAFASQSVAGTVGNFTLTSNEIPAHLHGIPATTVGALNPGGETIPRSVSNPGTLNTRNTGGGAAHNHTFTGTAINLAVQYVDVIIATKD